MTDRLQVGRPGRPLVMSKLTPERKPDDHRGLMEAERTEAEVETEREDEAVHRTDQASEEYEAKKQAETDH